MAIGKAMVTMICFMIAIVALVTMFAIAQKDKSTDAMYLDANNTINGTVAMTEKITGTGTGYLLPFVLVVAIMFFGSVIVIYRK
jgi:hypothetical protein